MSFLKKVGQLIITGAAVAAGVAPLAAGIFPQAKVKISEGLDYLQQLASIVVTAEAFGQIHNLPGAERLKGITPIIAQMIKQSDMLIGHDGKPRKIQDVALFDKGCASLGSGMADILNSLDASNVEA